MKYLIITITLITIFLVSCNNEVTNINVKKKQCIQEGVYCKGTAIYTCKNSDYGEAIEEIVEICENGYICSNNECVQDDCDEVINCVSGEKRCTGENTYKVCGNYDKDLCFEWQNESCEDGFTCHDGNCTPQVCIPKTCDDLNKACGSVYDDGCGNTLECGNCGENQSCNDDGECIDDACIPDTCDNLGIECGSVSNNCEGTLDCGGCGANQSCNDNGQCIDNCIPQTCENLGMVCGSINDACGTLVTCGTCNANQSCNNNGQCVENCVPDTCVSLGIECGSVSNNCGRMLQCGGCDGNLSCNDEGLCVDTCINGEHKENGECVSNEKDALCLPTGAAPNNSHSVSEYVTIYWTETDGWSTAEECLWECDNDYHLESDICEPNSKEVPCDTTNIPIHADYDDLPTTIIWENGNWTSPEECPWECPEDRHLDTENNFCVFTRDREYCDGLDNDNDGIIDNRNNTPGSICPENCFGKTYNGHVYIFCNNEQARSWSEAESICSNNNGYLITINNQNENNFISQNINEIYWIGYSQDGDDSDELWYWNNGDNNDFENWNSGEPNNACIDWAGPLHLVCTEKENCANIINNSNASWNDSDCDDDKSFICEFETTLIY